MGRYQISLGDSYSSKLWFDCIQGSLERYTWKSQLPVPADISIIIICAF
jgi:hypothetical protein